MNLPLSTRRVVVTRNASENNTLGEIFRRLGAEVVELDLISIVQPPDGGAHLKQALSELSEGRYTWVVFTSANAVNAVIQVGGQLSRVKIAAVGSATERLLLEQGLHVDLVPKDFGATGLVEEFHAPTERDQWVLFPKSTKASNEVPDGLAKLGWKVEAPDAYQTVPQKPDASVFQQSRGADAICFASASAVEAFVDLGQTELPSVVVCIGPACAQRAESLGIKVSAIAQPHTAEGLVAAITKLLTQN